ncbi:MAG: hypothetical protein K2X11_14065 [Acetobacteraceae bacterium]|nr:hypothetical protein [Acetobacteraceae bacterium]
MPPEIRARLLVLDTGPLITLAAADSLDYLLYPGLPVVLPDAVLFEATNDASRLGAQAVLEWVQKHEGPVRTVSTHALFDHLQLLSAGQESRQKNLGERAAIEVINEATELAPNERVLLLSEDDRALRAGGATAFDRFIPLTTLDFLTELEVARRINSAEEVYQRAADGGRLASRREALRSQTEAAIAAVQAILQKQQ